MIEDKLPHRAEFRFYAELNDFLPPAQRGSSVAYSFGDAPGIKDPIEALGVPHPEVALIIAEGEAVGFDYRLQPGDRIAVYPPFFQIDAEFLTPLRAPLADARFVLDVHLGKLARLLRLLGIDVLYRNDYRDAELVNIAEGEGRVLLTRDRRLLFHRRLVYGRFVRNTDPIEQAKEIISRFDLKPFIRPFSRCTQCNGRVVEVSKEEVLDRLQPKTAKYYEEFFQCGDCGQVYWKGSHFEGLLKTLEHLRPGRN